MMSCDATLRYLSCLLGSALSVSDYDFDVFYLVRKRYTEPLCDQGTKMVLVKDLWPSPEAFLRQLIGEAPPHRSLILARISSHLWRAALTSIHFVPTQAVGLHHLLQLPVHKQPAQARQA